MTIETDEMKRVGLQPRLAIHSYQLTSHPLSSQQFTGATSQIHAMTGFYCVKVGSCQLPCCLTFNFFCPDCLAHIPGGPQCGLGGDDFFLYPVILPVPMCFPCALSGCAMGGFAKAKEADVLGSTLVLSGMTGSQGNSGHEQPFGELVPIDEARSALACDHVTW